MGDLRKIRKIRIRRNPANHQIEQVGSDNELHRILEESGALESIYINEEIDNHCGCARPVGGKCAQCGRYSCIRCHTHCGGTDNPSPLGCGKPLCRECSNYLPLPNGTSLPLCGSCYAKFSRKKFRNDITKFITGFGIDFDE